MDVRFMFCPSRQDYPNENVEEAEHRAPHCTSKYSWKYLALAVSLLCIIGCFIFASMGYVTKLNNCDQKPSGHETCDDTSPMFEQARHFRVAAAMLFITGIGLIVGVLWATKKDTDRGSLIRNQIVVVSDVTAEGLMKTDAPDLPHPHVQVHHSVEELYGDEINDDGGLPKYESAMELETCTCQASNVSSRSHSARQTPVGVELEDSDVGSSGNVSVSVSIQVDEDELNPPPSYSQALRIEQEMEEIENG